MRDPIRLLILGTGRMGCRIARLVLEKPGLELVGAWARRPARAGRDVGLAMGLGHYFGVPINGDLEVAIAQGRPDVAIQATGSTLGNVRGEIETLLDRGVCVISIAEEMAFPAARSPEIAGVLHTLAQKNGAAVLGTGINPGFVLDLLIITLTGVCSDVASITARRVNDLSPFGPTVLLAQGVGLTPEDFRAGVADGSVTGHVGFAQSAHMIARALGWEIERIEEEREPIISQIQRATPFVTVEPGHVAGCLHTARAYRDGAPVITLVHPQQVKPELAAVETGDFIEIAGSPPVRLAGSPEIPGGQGTVGLAVNMIPRILNAAPGLYCMADLPPPSALLGDVRQFVDAPERRGSHG